MLPVVRLLALVSAFLAATGAAYPTWWLGAFSFRCKPPYHVESYTDDWGEWRVSSVCAPGTCCSNWAETGPLCTADACGMAESERVRLTTQYNAAEAARKKAQAAQESKDAQKTLKDVVDDWKEKEAWEDAEKLDEQPQFFSEWTST